MSAISEFFKKFRRGNTGDAVFQLIALAVSLILPLTILAIFVVLWVESEISREMFGIGFLWDPTWSNSDQIFGALTVIYGTLVTSAVAILLAGPVGIGIAAFLTEIASPRVNSVVGFFVEILAAVPSIVYGIWGFFVFAVFLRGLDRAADTVLIRVDTDLSGQLSALHHLYREPRAVRHDPTYRGRDLARRPERRAARPAGGDAGPRLYPLGDV